LLARLRSFRADVHRYRQHLREAHGDPARSAALFGQYRALLDRWAALAEELHETRHDLGLLPPPTWGRARPPAGASADSLTPREWEVARSVSRGLRNHEIADALVVTPGTVANHVRKILMKLGLRSRAELAAWVVRHEQAESGS
jgi:DNA-binding NarL/FixJ family response regulator